jgi:hypothetical protein
VLRSSEPPSNAASRSTRSNEQSILTRRASCAAPLTGARRYALGPERHVEPETLADKLTCTECGRPLPRALVASARQPRRGGGPLPGVRRTGVWSTRSWLLSPRLGPYPASRSRHPARRPSSPPADSRAEASGSDDGPPGARFRKGVGWSARSRSEPLAPAGGGWPLVAKGDRLRISDPVQTCPQFFQALIPLSSWRATRATKPLQMSEMRMRGLEPPRSSAPPWPEARRGGGERHGYAGFQRLPHREPGFLHEQVFGRSAA